MNHRLSGQLGMVGKRRGLDIAETVCSEKPSLPGGAWLERPVRRDSCPMNYPVVLSLRTIASTRGPNA